jgi:hypothetical protein
MKLNPSKFKLKNYGLKNSNANLILTPLAEKERSKMGNNEKEQFNAAERFGVVMRRIEYTNLLSQSGTSASENGKVFFVMKDAVAKIEKCWRLYKYSKKRRLFRGMKLLEKYIKRKVLNFFDYLNNEKLKYIYMSHNPSMLSFKNDLDSTNTNNQKLKNNNNNSNRNINNYQNNKFNDSLNDDNNNNDDINNNNKNAICFIGEIKIDGEQKKPQNDLKKDYGKIILNYKMQQDELNKYKIENSNLKNKINSLNKDIDILKKEKDDLIKSYESISENYNKLLKDYESLNQNYSNLLNNNQIKSNSAKKNTFSIRESDEYISLLNENNNLNEEYNKLLKENELIKYKCQELNNIINWQNNDQRKNDENITNQFASLEEQIKEYKIKNENLNNELLKAKNDYELLIKNLNVKIDQLTKEKNELQNSLKLNNINDNGNNDYTNQIELLRNKINEYENKIKEYENKIKAYENKEINVYPKQINELKNINESYEKQILFLKSQIEKSKKENVKIKNEEEIDNLNKDNININNDTKIVINIDNKKITSKNEKQNNFVKKESNTNKNQLINKNTKNLNNQSKLKSVSILEKSKNKSQHQNLGYIPTIIFNLHSNKITLNSSDTKPKIKSKSNENNNKGDKKINCKKSSIINNTIKNIKVENISKNIIQKTQTQTQIQKKVIKNSNSNNLNKNIISKQKIIENISINNNNKSLSNHFYYNIKKIVEQHYLKHQIKKIYINLLILLIKIILLIIKYLL